MNPSYAAIAQRTNHRCEYCKAPEVVFNLPFEVEHIVPLFRRRVRWLWCIGLKEDTGACLPICGLVFGSPRRITLHLL
ncbi:MAG: hypothetical protein NW224_15025 [Leptolyngbyaceae cyanobacterium bins.302]|nr:hypothetical protein [Leptolyngbyaceae cyanobacterium bins.302]